MREVIRVATLNTEGGQSGPHRANIQRFLAHYSPHILGVQEIFPPDASWLQSTLNSQDAAFLPNFEVQNPLSDRIDGVGLYGIALIAAFTSLTVTQHYFTQEKFPCRPFICEQDYPTSRGVLTATYAVGNRTLRVATTHFTWSPDGSNTPEQWDDWNRLSTELHQQEPDLIMGDFNVPRGTKLGDTITRRYRSVLPPTISTTIDHQLHKDPRLPPRVVDYILIPKRSQVRVVPNSVQVCTGVSDHCAIVCDIMYR